MKPLPDKTGVIIIGAGLAGAATAWALGQTNLAPGVIVACSRTGMTDARLVLPLDRLAKRSTCLGARRAGEFPPAAA